MCKLKIPSTCSVDGHESLTYCLLPKWVLLPALQLCFCHITLVPCSSHSALQGLPGSLNCLPRPFSVCPPSSIFPPPTFPAKLVFVLQWKHTIYLLTHKSSTITFPAICILTYQKTLDPSLVKLFLSPQPQAHLPEFQQKMLCHSQGLATGFVLQKTLWNLLSTGHKWESHRKNTLWGR